MSILQVNDRGEKCFDRRLQECIEQGYTSEIQSILKNVEAYHQIRDSRGRTLLHWAAGCGNCQFVQHLISLGAKVDAQDCTKQTPLMVATDLDKELVIRILLEANADFYMPNIYGQCALGTAFKIKNCVVNKNRAIARTRQFGYNRIGENVVYNSVLLNKVTVESLRNSKYVERDVFHSDCPLYRFVRSVNPEIIRILLEKGSPVDARMPFTRKTSLHLVAAQLDCEKVKLLLKYGANINARDTDGQAPLLSCLITPFSPMSNIVFDMDRSLKCIETLLDLGADPHIFNKNQYRLLSMYRHPFDQLIVPIVAKIILQESYGQPIKPITQDCIKSYTQLKHTFKSIKLIFEDFKQIEIFNSVTLFDFVSDNKFIKFAKNKCFVEHLSHTIKEYNCMLPYFNGKLEQRFSRFSQLVEWRETMLSVIIEVFSKFCNLSVDGIAEKILEYLQHEKWVEILLNP